MVVVGNLENEAIGKITKLCFTVYILGSPKIIVSEADQ